MARTQLYTWVASGPEYIPIPDKVGDEVPNDRGATRITGLRASGLPGGYYAILDKTPTSDAGVRRDDTQITQFGTWAAPQALQATIVDKTPAVSDAKAAADTYLVYVSLSNTDTIIVETTDTYRVSLTLAGSPARSRVGTDAYRPVLTLTSSVSRGGATSVSRSDSYVPVLTLATGTLLAAEYYAATDTYTPVLTLADAVLAKEDIKTASDSYVPVLSFGYQLTPHTSAFVPVSDAYRVTLTLAGTPTGVVRDVDRIVGSLGPTGIITGKWV